MAAVSYMKRKAASCTDSLNAKLGFTIASCLYKAITVSTFWSAILHRNISWLGNIGSSMEPFVLLFTTDSTKLDNARF